MFSQVFLWDNAFKFQMQSYSYTLNVPVEYELNKTVILQELLQLLHFIKKEQ